MELKQRKIVLGVCGGVAAYKACELVRLMRAEGADVQVVMTASAQRFIGAASFQALSGHPVFDDLWHNQSADGMAHIALTRDADAMLIAPASAHRLAMLAQGQADDALTTLALARPHRRCPLLVAPAMNVEMWENPATQRNIERLRADGVRVLGPGMGVQACGEVGLGRMLEPSEILQELIGHFHAPLLRQRRVLITAGPTFEALDPVRGITNRSSGKMGYALARAAHEAGAEVTLVSGPVALPTPYGVRRIDVISAQQMLDAVLNETDQADVFVAVAAVADWRPAQVADAKQKKQAGAAAPVWSLTENPDILATVARLPQPPLCVGFAAETHDVVEHARAKLKSKGIALVVANQVQEVLGNDQAALYLIDPSGVQTLPAASKLTQARHIVAALARKLADRVRA
jgi:phosphopantothenoylcysteine decarboxylase/phosphopantothenate--cysteine ligase